MIVADVLVVGGGIVGAAVASACAKRGLRVALCERGALASGASSLDLALLSGALAPPELRATAERSVQEYGELHRFTGGAFFLDPSVLDEGGPRRIDARAAAAALVDEARSYRAHVQTCCEVKRLLVRAGVVGGAITDAGEIRAETTVVAAGAGSWRVCRDLPVHVPVRSAPTDILVTEPAPFRLERPVIAGSAWIAQDVAGRLVAAGPDTAAGAFPELADLPVLERRSLAAPVTPDGLPLHGPLPGVGGLVLACGHGHYGISCAPGVGAAIAEGVATGAWDATLGPTRLVA